MHLSTSLLALTLIALVSATLRLYNTFQISSRVGGQAQQEAIAAFPGALDSLTGTALSDVNVCVVLNLLATYHEIKSIPD
jgi:hypothetical protein